jgi:hypothetical protein
MTTTSSRSTEEDRRIANEWMMVLKDPSLSKADRTDFQEMVWYLGGIQLPMEVLTIIKGYLFIPETHFTSKCRFMKLVLSSSLEQACKWASIEFNANCKKFKKNIITPEVQRLKTIQIHKTLIGLMGRRYRLGSKANVDSYAIFADRYCKHIKDDTWVLKYTVGQEVLYKKDHYITSFYRKGIITKINKCSVGVRLYNYTTIIDEGLINNRTAGYNRLQWEGLSSECVTVYTETKIATQHDVYVGEEMVLGKKWFDAHF